MEPIVALEMGDLNRAESVIRRAKQGVPVNGRIVLEARCMVHASAIRIRDLTGLNPLWRCPDVVPASWESL